MLHYFIYDSSTIQYNSTIMHRTKLKKKEKWSEPI